MKAKLLARAITSIALADALFASIDLMQQAATAHDVTRYYAENLRSRVSIWRCCTARRRS